MKFLIKKKKNADKEIAAGRDDEKQEVQNQTEDDMDEESLANGRDNVIEVKRSFQQPEHYFAKFNLFLTCFSQLTFRYGLLIIC